MKTIQVSDETWAEGKKLAMSRGEPLGAVVGWAIQVAAGVNAEASLRRRAKGEAMGVADEPTEGLKQSPEKAKKSEGSASDPLHGLPEAIGVTEPLTHRPGGYMGIPREPVGPPKIGSDAWLSMFCRRCGHTRRVHLDMRKGADVPIGCALCAARCRGFEEPE